MYTYKFTDGTTITSNLSKNALSIRMNRLDTLRVLTEGFTEGEGKSICEKALKAYNKLDGFTGIIRLTFLERDFLSYMLEDSMLSEKDRAVIKFYTKYEEP